MTRRIVIHEYITGGGLAGKELPQSLAAEGSAMRRALVCDFSALGDIDVVMTLDSRLQEPSGDWMVVPVGSGEEIETLIKLASDDADVLVIAPETDGILEERARLLESLPGCRSLGSLPQAIAMTTNKLDLCQVWMGLGIRTPPTWLLGAETPLPAELHFPVVVKPIDGAGCMDTILIVRFEELPHESESLIVQPLIRGIPMSATFLADSTDQTHLLAVGYQRIRTDEDRFAYEGGRLPAPNRFCDANVRAAMTAIPGLRGLVGIDFLWTEAGSMVLEINPRPTTSIVAILDLLPPGMLAKAWLAAIMGPYQGPDFADLMDEEDLRQFDPDGKVVPL